MGNLIWNHNPQFVALKKLHRNLYLNFIFAKRAFKWLRAFFTKGKELLNVFYPIKILEQKFVPWFDFSCLSGPKVLSKKLFRPEISRKAKRVDSKNLHCKWMEELNFESNFRSQKFENFKNMILTRGV